MNIIRKILAWFIKPGKEPTRENILKYALKNYLNEADGTYIFGLCHYLNASIMHYLNVRTIYCADIKRYIPLYDNSIAVKYFKAMYGMYWWEIIDWQHRYRFMKWLIKQYKE